MKSKPFEKRIISGEFKGVKLDLPSKDTTRSSKAIVLESFFNTLQFDIVDATFVELFSGSGSIGLEALSRGAAEVIFFERDTNAFKVLQKNIAKTAPERTQAIKGDTFENINMATAYLKKNTKEAFFYIDPPFSYRDEMGDIYEKMIRLIENLHPDVVDMIIIEHMSTLKLDAEIGPFTCKKRKKFGKTTLSYYEDRT